MSRFVSVCLLTVTVFVAAAGVRLLGPVPVLAADAVVGIDAPLHGLPDAGSPLLALLPEGTAVTIEGPPVDGFYPVSAAGMSGWVIGETLLAQKEVAGEGDGVAEEAGTPMGEEVVPVEQTASESAAPVDQAYSEVTPDPAAAGNAADPALASPPPDPALESSTLTPVATEAVPADASPTETAIAGEAPAATPSPDAASGDVAVTAATPVPDPALAAPTPDPAASPTAVVEPGPWGPASTVVNMPIRTGPGPEHALIFSVPQGSAVEQTGQAANGYVSVRYKEVVGWAAAEHLGPPIEVAPETLSEEAGEPIDTKTPRPGSGVAYTTVDLSLRSEPSANSEPIMSIPAGSRVVLTGVMEYDFQRVNFRDQIGWVANQFLANPPNPEPSEERRAEYRTYSEQQIIKIIYAAADQYGQSRQDMLRVARCESNLDPYAVNPSGSYGLFQFIRSTWKSTPYGSADIFDPKANAGAAAWMWSEGRKSEWVCQ
jgi:uncharacterized protein YraI